MKKGAKRLDDREETRGEETIEREREARDNRKRHEIRSLGEEDKEVEEGRRKQKQGEDEEGGEERKIRKRKRKG